MEIFKIYIIVTNVELAVAESQNYTFSVLFDN